MAKKKGMNFLNFIGLGSSEEPVEEDMYDEEEAPVVNNRRDNYSNSRSYQRSEPPMQEQDYGYDSGYDDDYRDPQPQGTTTYGSSSKIINHPAVAARHRTMIYQLDSYEDSKDVIDDLLEGHSVLINLEALDLPEAAHHRYAHRRLLCHQRHHQEGRRADLPARAGDGGGRRHLCR